MAQGYEVKAEIEAADVVACRGEEPPVIVELKTGFSLALIHQAIDRLALSDTVYVAAPHKVGKASLKARREMTRLCRRLGLGLITVREKDGFVEVHCDPGPYAPRQQPRLRARLLREFARREGDPNLGGAARKGGVVTAYRQDALRCARHLANQGPTKGAVVAREAGVERATRIMADDHYGWFERVSLGVYALTPNGAAALDDWKGALPEA